MYKVKKVRRVKLVHKVSKDKRVKLVHKDRKGKLALLLLVVLHICINHQAA